MTGPFDSILGRRTDRVLESTLTFNPTHFEVASGDVRLLATVVEVDPQTGKAASIRRISLTQAEADELAKSSETPPAQLPQVS
jgi:calcineurin-like phosphoesterase